METYRVGDVSTLFHVQSNTIRRWCQEFSDYLSEEANPAKGTTRQFSENDIAVFALVAQMQNQRRTFTDMHASLKSGTRGEIPKSPTEITPTRNLLALQVQELTEQLETSHDEIVRLTSILETTVESGEKNLVKAEQKIDDLLKERASLNQQIGKLQAQLEASEKKG